MGYKQSQKNIGIFWLLNGANFQLSSILLLLQNINQTRIYLTKVFLYLWTFYKYFYRCWIFIICIILFGLYAGTNYTKNCKWSLSATICQKYILYLLDISRYITFIIIRSSFSSIIIFLYLTGYMKWYISINTLCDLCLYLLVHNFLLLFSSIVSFPIRYDKVCFRNRTAENQIWRDLIELNLIKL